VTTNGTTQTQKLFDQHCLFKRYFKLSHAATARKIGMGISQIPLHHLDALALSDSPILLGWVSTSYGSGSKFFLPGSGWINFLQLG